MRTIRTRARPGPLAGLRGGRAVPGGRARCCVALDFNQDNALVEFVIDGADAVDLGVFSREDGIKEFTGDNAETKNALFNWGLGAVAWLVVGRILERADPALTRAARVRRLVVTDTAL